MLNPSIEATSNKILNNEENLRNEPLPTSIDVGQSDITLITDVVDPQDAAGKVNEIINVITNGENSTTNQPMSTGVFVNLSQPGPLIKRKRKRTRKRKNKQVGVVAAKTKKEQPGEVGAPILTSSVSTHDNNANHTYNLPINIPPIIGKMHQTHATHHYHRNCDCFHHQPPPPSYISYCSCYICMRQQLRPRGPYYRSIYPYHLNPHGDQNKITHGAGYFSNYQRGDMIQPDLSYQHVPRPYHHNRKLSQPKGGKIYNNKSAILRQQSELKETGAGERMDQSDGIGLTVEIPPDNSPSKMTKPPFNRQMRATSMVNIRDNVPLVNGDQPRLPLKGTEGRSGVKRERLSSGDSYPSDSNVPLSLMNNRNSSKTTAGMLVSHKGSPMAAPFTTKIRLPTEFHSLDGNRRDFRSRVNLSSHQPLHSFHSHYDPCGPYHPQYQRQYSRQYCPPPPYNSSKFGQHHLKYSGHHPNGTVPLMSNFTSPPFFKRGGKSRGSFISYSNSSQNGKQLHNQGSRPSYHNVQTTRQLGGPLHLPRVASVYYQHPANRYYPNNQQQPYFPPSYRNQHNKLPFNKDGATNLQFQGVGRATNQHRYPLRKEPPFTTSSKAHNNNQSSTSYSHRGRRNLAMIKNNRIVPQRQSRYSLRNRTNRPSQPNLALKDRKGQNVANKRHKINSYELPHGSNGPQKNSTENGNDRASSESSSAKTAASQGNKRTISRAVVEKAPESFDDARNEGDDSLVAMGISKDIPHAPKNDNEFLMQDHYTDAHGHIYTPSNYVHGLPTSAEDFGGFVMGGLSAEEYEEELFLEKEFAEEYDSVRNARLNSMTKAQLIQEVLYLEAQLEEREKALMLMKMEEAPLMSHFKKEGSKDELETELEDYDFIDKAEKDL